MSKHIGTVCIQTEDGRITMRVDKAKSLAERLNTMDEIKERLGPNRYKYHSDWIAKESAGFLLLKAKFCRKRCCDCDYRPLDLTAKAAASQLNRYMAKPVRQAPEVKRNDPKSKGIFSEGEQLTIRGSLFEVKNISTFGIKLKLLRQPEDAANQYYCPYIICPHADKCEELCDWGAEVNR